MSPIGFSGSGIWLIKRPGFWISEERGARFGIADINAGREGGGGGSRGSNEPPLEVNNGGLKIHYSQDCSHSSRDILRVRASNQHNEKAEQLHEMYHGRE